MLQQNISQPFKGKTIVISGVFKFPVQKIKNELIRGGAILKEDVTRNTDLIICGINPKESVMQKFERFRFSGYIIPRIDEDSIIRMLRGGNVTLEKPRKQLSITSEHLERLRFQLNQNVVNELANKEIFLDKTVRGDMRLMRQLIGFHGGYCNADMNDVTICIISLSSWQDVVNGAPNETISMIEQQFNSSRAREINFRFIPENEVLEYMMQRNEKVADEMIAGWIDNYKQSF